MPLSTLLLVLLAALLHATWNIAAKHAGGDHRFAFLTACITTVVWAPAAWVFGADEVPRWTGTQWAAVCGSAAIHVVYFLTLLRGYRQADLTVVYPVARGSGPLVTAAGAVLLLGETLTPGAMAGVLAVCGGVFLVAGGPALWRGRHDAAARARLHAGFATRCAATKYAAARARLHAGLRWGGMTGLLIAGYSVLDGYAVKALLMGPVVFDYFGNVLRVPLQLPLVWRDAAGLRATLRRQWRAALVVSTLGPLAYMLVLYAVTMAPLSHVAPAREVSMLLAALIGGRLLGERERGTRLLGAGCIAAGVVALAW